MNIGSFIDVCFGEENPLIRFKGDIVPGIQEFVCDLWPDMRRLKCVLYALQEDEGEIQKGFVAELAKHGFDIEWRRYWDYVTPDIVNMPNAVEGYKNEPIVNNDGIEITWGGNTSPRYYSLPSVFGNYWA